MELKRYYVFFLEQGKLYYVHGYTATSKTYAMQQYANDEQFNKYPSIVNPNRYAVLTPEEFQNNEYTRG